MTDQPNDPGRNDSGDRRNSRVPALVGLLLIAILVAAAYWLVEALRENGKLQDCLASGRTNCAPIEVPARPGSGR